MVEALWPYMKHDPGELKFGASVFEAGVNNTVKDLEKRLSARVAHEPLGAQEKVTPWSSPAAARSSWSGGSGFTCAGHRRAGVPECRGALETQEARRAPTVATHNLRRDPLWLSSPGKRRWW